MRMLNLKSGVKYCTNQQGITLIELVIVIIVFSILAVPLSQALLTVSKTIVINEEVKIANNLAQACAEHILHQRRSGTTTFPASASSTMCDIVTGFAASGNLLIAVDTTAPLCPASSASCDKLTITANNSSGQTRASISLLFVYNP